MSPRPAADLLPAGAGRVHLVVALRAEAQPIIEHLRLSPVDRGAPFRVFLSVDERVALAISGSGRVAAGSAVEHLAGYGDDAGWLNVGIAGHGHRPLGSVVLAHRIRNRNGGRTWYPPLVFEPPCPTATVQTVDRACTDFPTDDVYDMEAAGFYGAAARYASHELVHCLKVISDNRDHSAARLTRKRVGELVGNNMTVIHRLVEALAALSSEKRCRHVEPVGLEAILGATHFTVTQQRQLRRALRRWSVLCPGTDPAPWTTAFRDTNARAMLQRIEAHLDRQAPAFGNPR